MLTARGHYGAPIHGKALAWNGLGDAPNYGIDLSNLWFVDNWFAIGMGINATRFNPIEGAVLGAEFEGDWRSFLWQSSSAGAFFDLKAGILGTRDPIPPGGTTVNYTFAFGPGFEIALGGNSRLVGGVEFHHMSNAKGRHTPRNPSQNERRYWIGWAITW